MPAPRELLTESARAEYADKSRSAPSSTLLVCSFPGCKTCPFLREADLRRHFSQAHEPVKVGKK
jgi:hypothetical protein